MLQKMRKLICLVFQQHKKIWNQLGYIPLVSSFTGLYRSLDGVFGLMVDAIGLGGGCIGLGVGCLIPGKARRDYRHNSLVFLRIVVKTTW